MKRPRPLTNENLREMFRKFNKLYWRKQLYEPRIIRFKDMPDSDGMCVVPHEDLPDAIFVDSNLRTHPRIVQNIMLHEMVHLHLGRDVVHDHGFTFGAEVTRLFNIGAYDGLL